MFETGAFLLNEKGNIDRLRTDDGAEYRIESTLSVEAANNANTAAEAAKEQTSKSTEAETARVAAETARADAEKARTTAEKERADQQVKNNADQAANNAAALGLYAVKLNEGQYDPNTLKPTISGQNGKMYLVPIPAAAAASFVTLTGVKALDEGDTCVEWMWADGWERVGLSNATLEGLTTDEIDSVVADGTLQTKSVLNGIGLSYLWTKLKAKFSTKAELKTVQDSLGRAHVFRDVLSSGDANNIQPGIYLVDNESVKNLPSGSAYSVLIDFGGIGGGCNDQILFNGNGKFMVRAFGGGHWSPWVNV